MFKRLSLLSSILILGSLSSTYANDVTPNLPKLNIDNDKISVIGISSGGYMAVQAQITFPEVFKKAGIVAGGPYACAENIDMVGSNGLAIFKCMDDAIAGYKATQNMTSINIKKWARLASERAIRSEKSLRANVSKLKELNGAIVYFLHGANDVTVIPEVVEAAKKVYENLEIIKTKKEIITSVNPVKITILDDRNKNFAHTFPTRAPRLPGGSDDCNHSVFPYIGHCGIDGAKLIFSNLYGKTSELVFDKPKSSVVKFNQRNGMFPDQAQMDTEGYAYIPQACKTGTKCGVMIALHGCNQSAKSLNPDSKNGPQNIPVGDKFATETGLNRWADTYDIVVLYPQVLPNNAEQVGIASTNFNGCWDWFGYTGRDFDLRSAKQTRGLINMLVALGYKKKI